MRSKTCAMEVSLKASHISDCSGWIKRRFCSSGSFDLRSSVLPDHSICPHPALPCVRTILVPAFRRLEYPNPIPALLRAVVQVVRVWGIVATRYQRDRLRRAIEDVVYDLDRAVRKATEKPEPP
jgi:hypothetical protein